MSVLAALVVLGCNQQDPAGKSLDTPTVDQTTEAASTKESQSFMDASAAFEQAGVANWKSVSLASTQEQWIPTGLQVEAGISLPADLVG